MHNSTPHEWTPLEISLMEETAERTWAAVERAHAEGALRDREERLRLALSAGQMGTWQYRIGPDEDILDPRMSYLLGLAPQEQAVPLEAFMQAIHGDDRSAVRELFARCMRAGAGARDQRGAGSASGGGEFDTEFRVVWPDGSVRWLRDQGMVVPDGDGAPRGLAGVAMDITARKRVELALQESEQNLQGVANIVPELLWYSEPDGSTPWYNGRWLEYTGQTLEQAIGWGWVQTIHPADREGSARRYREAVEAGQALQLEHRIRRHDGEYRWFLVRAEPLLDGNGRVTRMYGGATDMHEQRLAHEELERRVRERTAELATANETLRRLSMRVLEVQEAERRHIARELHDQIGQYLTGLRLMLDRLQPDAGAAAGKAPNEQQSKQLAATQEVLSEMTERVRELALDLRPTMLDDYGLLPALQWYLERYQAQTGIAVEFHQMGPEARLSSRLETTVYRVIQEALTNVARHACAKQVTVQVIADGQLTVMIEDDGQGFDVARRLAEYASTGVSAMRERVELVGGAFSIDSTPGHGTTVIVDIPLASPAPNGAAEGA